MRNRVMIVGLDAATWDLIEPWVQQGRLPHFQYLMEHGAWGPLESSFPPITAVAWNSFATGKNPGKHGVFDFIRRDAGGYGLHAVNGSARRATPFWRILDPIGLQVGVINMPMTYPPDPLEHGFIISGFDTPGFDSDFVHPRELKEKLREWGYVVHANPKNRQIWVDSMLRLFQIKRRTFFELYATQPWDVLMMVFMELDQAQHLLWRDMAEGEPPYGDVIPQLYAQADEVLGQVLDRLRANDTLIVVSDHGAGPLKRVVSINHWLRREGWLALRDQGSPEGVWRQQLLRAYRMLNRKTPRRIRSAIKDRFAWMRDRAESYILAAALDWEQTRAFALGEYGGIFINLKGREKQGIVAPEQYDLLRDEIAARLLTLRDPDNGEQVILNVYRREQVYHGPYLEEAPDLILDWSGGYDCRERVGSEHHAVFESEAGYRDAAGAKKTGVHRQQGILLLHGPAVQPGPVQGAHLMDVVPTLLYLLGLPVPKSMDGRVLRHALAPRWLAEHPIMYSETQETAEGGPDFSYTPEEEVEFKSRLRSLGYLD